MISEIEAPIFNFAFAPYDARRRRKRTSIGEILIVFQFTVGTPPLCQLPEIEYVL